MALETLIEDEIRPACVAYSSLNEARYGHKAQGLKTKGLACMASPYMP